MPIQTKQQPPYYSPTAKATIYLANSAQTSTNAPVMTIQEHNFATLPIWTRSATGIYLFTSTTAIFDELKTSMIISGINQGFAYYVWGDPTWLELHTRDLAGNPSDDILGGYTTILIQIQP